MSIYTVTVLTGKHRTETKACAHMSHVRISLATSLAAMAAKTGMVHYVSGWMWGVQVKLWDHLRMRAIPEHLRGVIMTRRYTNPRLPYLTRPGCETIYHLIYDRTSTTNNSNGN